MGPEARRVLPWPRGPGSASGPCCPDAHGSSAHSAGTGWHPLPYPAGGREDSLWATPCWLLHPEEGSPCPRFCCLPLYCLFYPADPKAPSLRKRLRTERLRPAPGEAWGVGWWPVPSRALRPETAPSRASSPCVSLPARLSPQPEGPP